MCDSTFELSKNEIRHLVLYYRSISMSNLPMNEDGFVTKIFVGTKVYIDSQHEDASELPYIIVEIVGNKVVMYHPSEPMMLTSISYIAKHYSVA